jgi:outer membrane protein OmpA-like peptidoglycan-associated protein
MRRLLGTLVAAAVFAHDAAAGATPGFAVERFDPSERGSAWFAADSLDLRGAPRPALGLVVGWERKPLVVTGQDGGARTAIVSDVVATHLGGAVVLADRLRLALDLPLVLYTTGDQGVLRGDVYDPPRHAQALGDLRLAADARLFGAHDAPVTAALGAQLGLPTGSPPSYTSDGSVRFTPHALVAGSVAPIVVWAAKVGVAFRDTDAPSFGGGSIGTELVFALAAGARLADERLTVGPELFGGTVLAHDAWKTRTTPLEALLGAHYELAGGVRVGAGAGAGVVSGYGSPAFRLLASAEWAPPIVPPPPVVVPPPPPVDTDGDGIPDAEDACMDVRGPRTNDPRTTGCGDRDGDGVPDPIDACPDVPGVASPDPKKNGCLLDSDGDGIPDVEDACPRVPGERTEDPKTNGCPPDPDRDHDGIPNTSDACPDEPGPADPVPGRNGCPAAFARGGRIVLRDQPEFGAKDARLLLPQSEPALKAIAAFVGEHQEIERVRVEGHTDNVGDPAANTKLSADRARAVVEWLVGRGVDRARLTSVGRGGDRPVDANDTEEGRRKNRRIELWIETSHP